MSPIIPEYFAVKFSFDTSALILSDESLLGTASIEMMGLTIRSAARKLSVNLASPYVPAAVTK